jgi:gluconolactonase
MDSTRANTDARAWIGRSEMHEDHLITAFAAASARGTRRRRPTPSATVSYRRSRCRAVSGPAAGLRFEMPFRPQARSRRSVHARCHGYHSIQEYQHTEIGSDFKGVRKNAGVPSSVRERVPTMLIKGKSGPNPLKGWQVDRTAISFVGHDLQRPEGILAESDGTLWTADARGGVMKIAPDGTQTLITQSVDTHFDLTNDARNSLLHGTLPNGIAFASNGDILIANFGTDRLEIMTRDGSTRVLCDSIDGTPMGKVNFVLRDSKDRIWITVSTRINPWSRAVNAALADGYIALLDDTGLRIVADGFAFTNEIRLDADEEWLYVAETTGKRVSRLRVQPDGSLVDREVYGPSNLGAGVIDGIAFDSYGNLWATMIFADRLIAITPDGELIELLSDGNSAATAKFEAEFATGDPVRFEIMAACGGTIAPWLASVTFGGPDLRTAYLGSLRGTTLPAFRSPVAGLPMVHWHKK